MAVLTWDYGDYYPYKLAQMPQKELRAEYSRLRKIANKRLQRLEKSIYRDTELAKEYKGGFATLANVQNIERELTALARFVASERSSISGLKKLDSKAVRTLQSHGYTFVNASNIRQFGNFMEELRQAGLSKIYSSEQTATWWSEQAKSKQGNPELLKKEFEKYVDRGNKG